MRQRWWRAGVLTLALAAVWPSSSQAKEAMPQPAYLWAARATLVVAGRVESADAKSGTLRITRTLTGQADGETLVFAPTTIPRCPTGQRSTGPAPSDVSPGDEIALFLVKGDDGTYDVVDNGYGMVGLAAPRVFTRSSLADVERLVSIMKTADLAARDRAMLAAATAEDDFLRRAACRYVSTDLGVAQPFDRWRAKAPEEAAASEQHRAAVRRLGDEVAVLVRRENGGDVTAAAIAALADASCAPRYRFDEIVKFARAIERIDVYQFRDACRVLACYDTPEAAEALVKFTADHPDVLALSGASRSAKVRRTLLVEFSYADDRRAAEAARGLGQMLERGRDTEIEDALLARLRGPVDPSVELPAAWALRTARPLDAVNAVFDKLASSSLTKEGEQAGADALYWYLRADPPIAGVRDLIVARQAVILDRLDAGKTEATRPLYLLQQLGTPEAMASLRRAAASHPDAAMRREARSRSEPLGR